MDESAPEGGNLHLKFHLFPGVTPPDQIFTVGGGDCTYPSTAEHGGCFGRIHQFIVPGILQLNQPTLHFGW